MEKLTPLIPGFYADGQGCVLLNMREFLEAYGLPDAPELRAVIWDDVREIFGEVEVFEMPSGPGGPGHGQLENS